MSQLSWKRLSALDVTLEELENVVATNDKQRFTMKPNPNPDLPRPMSPKHMPSATSPNDPSRYLIRASQGHTLNVADEQLLKPLIATDVDCPAVVVHGTYPSVWPQIEHSGGLKPMGRKHIHFARGEPPKLPPLNANTQPTRIADDAEVVSGMRRDASVLVWVDVKGSMQAGIRWWQSDNGVILTTGVDGLLPLKWIVWAERRGIGEVIYGDKAKGLRMREAQSKTQLRGLRSTPVEQTEGEKGSGSSAGINGVLKQPEGNFSAGRLTVTGPDPAVSKGVEKMKIKENWDDSREASPEHA